ncbi:stage II sporulation protein R [Virgibacillus sp. YIM 98842]|uniref:stage II sporulation protein R n=1 Tax=Virgibacillus sp. YIM 98842 TaxID=2663533 RepID=UPI0013DC4870|nr:stage II sporulation protein R [Virgibacillus sp. YIM 98842]
MKKLLLFVFISFILFFTLPSQTVSHEASTDEEYQVIPDEAIRLRILANSDSEKDQQIKYMVRDEVNEEITEWVKDITDIDQARNLIESRTPQIENIVEDVLAEKGEDRDYSVDYGKNVDFPTRQYGPYVYPAGEYEAVLITIGEGSGSNWWCVLFPPLCFLDFSNEASAAAKEPEEAESTEETEETEETEVKFFLFEWLGWS